LGCSHDRLGQWADRQCTPRRHARNSANAGKVKYCIDCRECLLRVIFNRSRQSCQSVHVCFAPNGEIGRALKDPDFAGQLSAIGIDPIGSTPEEFGAFLRKEIPRWKQIVQDGEVKVEGDR
jgi:hypothetical protein